MATDKQIAANRANALKSTGPRTKEGKASSSKNALTHGALSNAALADGEDQAAFSGIHEALIEEHRPDTMTEVHLVERLALLFWREMRLAKAEVRDMMESKGHAPMLEGIFGGAGPRAAAAGEDSPADYVLPINKQILYGRYQTMLSNQISQTLKQLREEQKFREQVIDVTPQDIEPG